MSTAERTPLLLTVLNERLHQNLRQATVLSLDKDLQRNVKLQVKLSDCITETHIPSGSNYDRNKLIIAAAICLFFALVEGIGGYISNSLAIYTDASHMLTDLLGYFIQLTAMWIAKRPQSGLMTFGWYRAEVLGTVLSVFTIWIISGILVYLAILRVIGNEFSIQVNMMLITASIGIIINIIMGVVLWLPEDVWRSEKGSVNGNKGNINVRSALIHVWGDLIQSLGVFIAALIIKFQPTWLLADPICTFIFAIIVLCTTANILKDSFRVLMEGAPTDVDLYKIRATIGAMSGVKGIHSLHVWSLTADKNAISLHVAIDDTLTTYSDTISRISYYLNLTSPPFYYATVQVEPG